MLDPNGYPSRGQIARVLPADTAFQTVRTAAKLDFDVCDVLTMVVGAVALSARSPREQERAVCATTLTSPLILPVGEVRDTTALLRESTQSGENQFGNAHQEISPHE